MINWQSIVDSLKQNFSTLFHNLLITLLVFLGITVVLKIVKLIIRTILKNNLTTKYMEPSRRKTISYLLENMATYVLYGIGTFYVLTVFFGTVGVTVAGILSVAVGFGAQNFVKDILGGLSIIFENKFQVDDYIKLNTLSGYVEKIGIRATILRDDNGDLNIIPNGNIEEITNRSRKDRRIMAEVIVDHGQSVDDIFKAIEEAINIFNDSHEKLSTKATNKGIVDITEIGPKIRVQGYTDYEKSFGYEFELKKEIYSSFYRNGIKAPEMINFKRGIVL